MRAETVVAGHKIVSIVNGDTYTAYDATTRAGVAIGRAPEAIAKDAPGRRPFGREVEVIVGQGGEKVGEEVIGGRPCERYRVTDGAGRREVWVTKDELRLPVRLEIYTRLSGKTIYTDFVNWAAELDLDDGFFEPEPELRLEQLSFQEFADRGFTPVGPVPILYMDLLTGR
jgi:outer membrane lipoprotein-sorting protein